MEQTSCLGATP